MSRNQQYGLVVLLVALAIGSGRFASACTCAEVPLETEIEDADAIFTGTVLDTTRVNYSPEFYWQMTVAVDRFWKGAVTDRMLIYTAETGAGCGRLLYPGDEFLFFVYGHPESYGTSLCSSWTMPVSGASDVIAYLGPGQTVQVEAVTWGRIKALFR